MLTDSYICSVLRPCPMQRGDSVRVRMSPYPVPTINNMDQTADWFASIERCFRWSERVEQQPMPPPSPLGSDNGSLSSATFSNGSGDASMEGGKASDGDNSSVVPISVASSVSSGGGNGGGSISSDDKKKSVLPSGACSES